VSTIYVLTILLLKVALNTKNQNQNQWRVCTDYTFYLSFIYNIIFMATSFSGWRSRSTQREPPTIGKQLVNFITCGCESSAPFFVIYKSGHEPTKVALNTKNKNENQWRVFTDYTFYLSFIYNIILVDFHN
jgi:hypothetical protein